MTWKFEVAATKQRRLFSRILQALESQMVTIDAFAAETKDDAVHICFVISSEEDRAYRIEALLHRLEDVRSVSVSRRSEVLSG